MVVSLEIFHKRLFGDRNAENTVVNIAFIAWNNKFLPEYFNDSELFGKEIIYLTVLSANCLFYINENETYKWNIS